MNFFLMRAFLIFLCATLYSCYNLRLPRSGPLRVKSGRDVKPGQFGYVVRIESDLYFQILNSTRKHVYSLLCTGSVLTQTATLTAGHCCPHCYSGQLSEKEAEDTGILMGIKLVVRYGSTPGKADDQLDKFSDILNITKPGAAWGTGHSLFINDLAIFTTEPIQLKRYGKISSLDYPSLYGLRVTLMGYGATNHSKLDTDTKALNMPLQVVDGMTIKCDEGDFYSYTFPLLCTKSACGNPQGALGPGDSGGPVVHSTGIIGVNSKGFWESSIDHPDYRRVPLPTQVLIMPLSPYIDWLTKTLQKNMNS